MSNIIPATLDPLDGNRYEIRNFAKQARESKLHYLGVGRLLPGPATWLKTKFYC